MAAVAIVLAMSTFGCKNGGKGMDAVSPFVGTWKLTIVTDSVQNNGTWFKNETLPEGVKIPTRTGRLTVTRDSKTDEIKVLARIDIAGDSVDYYNTTAEYKDGKLVLNSGTDYKSSKGPVHFTFQPWAHNQGKFKVDAEYEFNSTKYVERATNYVE